MRNRLPAIGTSYTHGNATRGREVPEMPRLLRREVETASSARLEVSCVAPALLPVLASSRKTPRHRQERLCHTITAGAALARLQASPATVFPARPAALPEQAQPRAPAQERKPAAQQLVNLPERGPRSAQEPQAASAAQKRTYLRDPWLCVQRQ